MTSILGISSHYHDSAAALLVDGQLVAAAQEERFSRIKHDEAMPKCAMEYCLNQAGMRADGLDYVVYYEKPLAKFERLLETYLYFAPGGNTFFRKSIPSWLQSKLFLQRAIRKALNGKYDRRIVFAEHHLSHAAAAYYNSPFDDAAVLTVDGVGEWTTTAFGVGRKHQIILTHEIQFPHSLGLLYSTFTAYLGFRVNDGEYKVMGLASFGKPEYVDLILNQLMDLKQDGSFRLRMKYFHFCRGMAMFNTTFERLFGKPQRKPEEPVTEFHQNIAASIQAAVERILLCIATHVHRTTQCHNLVIAGGVGLNCVANHRIFKEGPFEQVWVYGAAGDAGGAVGAAQYVWHHLLQNSRTTEKPRSRSELLVGPAYNDQEIENELEQCHVPYIASSNDQELSEKVVDLLEKQKVIGWFQGRMEFGPRALGSRSILADPRNPAMKEIVNTKIKRREPFRPFAPAALAEHVHEYFDVPFGMDCSAMIFTVNAKPAASAFPSVIHVDGTVRLQTVHPHSDDRFRTLLENFYRRTHCPMLINTSFNVRDEPIVCNPRDALRCFQTANLDALVLGRCILIRENLSQSNWQSIAEVPEERLSVYRRAWKGMRGIIQVFNRVARVPLQLLVEVLMVLVYFTVFTPLGWVRRIMGWLRIDTTVRSDIASYWIARETQHDPQDHFRQSLSSIRHG